MNLSEVGTFKFRNKIGTVKIMSQNKTLISSGLADNLALSYKLSGVSHIAVQNLNPTPNH